MNAEEQMRALLEKQAALYPALEIQDLAKALYQAAHGCGHFVDDKVRAGAYLREEAKALSPDGAAPLTEEIGPRYSRVHLSPYLHGGGALDTLAALFTLSSVDIWPDRESYFQAGLALLEEMAATGKQSASESRAWLSAYREKGCPAVRHTQTFRDRYAPAYRVICSAYADLLPVFARVDALMAKKAHVCVAIDGMSGSGKTTLAALLERVYGAGVLHMDDFFLQMHQRTPERFSEPGGNVDYERFGSEVLAPLARNEAFAYRPYVCCEQKLGDPVFFTPGRVTVVEGSYSLHPELEAAYDLKICLRIDPAQQSARILARNGAAMHERFMREWVPLENLYFDKTDIACRCDMLLRVLQQEDGGVRWRVEANR